ncbi:hypothetical protein BJ138DRAFT_1168447 [Hygrophoropsis aurantiaca]|uniref:Uncharacterized protein n=1 Tax=Hygrophoropsis aurantiaca TaxID=72124 RepID=A0ACB7ZR68_9AGAM|nr:hypothetical protein BJ138DRAFT_1168447 [Hygrophoropsis aurantiaca]
MHRALLIVEIQLYIFNQIFKKRTLYALARTCQAFSETALNVLWGVSEKIKSPCKVFRSRFPR